MAPFHKVDGPPRTGGEPRHDGLGIARRRVECVSTPRRHLVAHQRVKSPRGGATTTGEIEGPGRTPPTAEIRGRGPPPEARSSHRGRGPRGHPDAAPPGTRRPGKVPRTEEGKKKKEKWREGRGGGRGGAGGRDVGGDGRGVGRTRGRGALAVAEACTKSWDPRPWPESSVAAALVEVGNRFKVNSTDRRTKSYSGG